MKINERLALSSSKLLLVPYSRHHVPSYHAWMQDPALQAATASEPLTLDEEYAMQASWRADADKLTFIVCAAPDPRGTVEMEGDIEPGVLDESESMIGDVNLFLSPAEEDEEEEKEEKQEDAPASARLPSGDDGDDGDNDDNKPDPIVGEIELMIARLDFQGRGYGRAALVAFMDYVLSDWSEIAREYSSGEEGSTRLPVMAYLRARINKDNARSIALFRSVGFDQVGGASYFGEIEMRWRYDKDHLVNVKGYEELSRVKYGSEG